MSFEDIVITEMKGLDEGVFTKKPNTHAEVSTQLSAHKYTPFIPLWAQKKMIELSDKEKYDKAVKNSLYTHYLQNK